MISSCQNDKDARKCAPESDKTICNVFIVYRGGCGKPPIKSESYIGILCAQMLLKVTEPWPKYRLPDADWTTHSSILTPALLADAALLM